MKKVYMVMETDVRIGRYNEVVMVFNNGGEACKYANQRADKKYRNLRKACAFELGAGNMIIKMHENRIYVYDCECDYNEAGGGLKYNCWVKEIEVHSKCRI